jgi:hypothetical protein
MSAGDTDDQEFSAAIDAMSDAYEAAAKAIDENDDTRLAFTQATELVERLQRMTDSAAAVRAQTVGRIWSSEEMSLAGLAQRIGVSKARADQLVRASKATKPEGTDDDE